MCRISPWAAFGAALLTAPVQWAAAGQIPSGAFFSLQRGMSESEVLVRAGPPDLVTTPGFETTEVYSSRAHDAKGRKPATFEAFRRSRTPVIERWHYVPDASEHDPYLTIITFRGGEVWELDRTKIFTRSALPPPEPESEREPRVSDHDLRVDRLDKTLEAAESYAATRRRLKDEVTTAAPGAAPDGLARPTIYRRVQPDGSTYYGDAPPGASFRIIDIENGPREADAQ